MDMQIFVISIDYIKRIKMIIYKTINLINNKIYVGQDTRNNPKYLGSGNLLKNAIKKYGIENFKKEILEDDIDDINILNEKEIYWIKKLNSKRPNGYNLTDGGCGNLGYEWTDEQRKTLSEAMLNSDSHKQIMESVEYKQKMSNANKGHKHSKKTKILISKNRKLANTPEFIEQQRLSHLGQIPWNKGKTKYTDKRLLNASKTMVEIHKNRSVEKKKEISNKISKKIRGRQMSEEFCRNASKRMKIIVKRPNYKKNMSESLKKVWNDPSKKKEILEKRKQTKLKKLKGKL